jgi:soluble lytic murein transglycosylase
MQLQPDALTWFANARAADNQYVLNDQQAGWLVRAALRESSVDPGQWTNVRRTITEMSETERRDPTWRYWLARSMATSTNANDLTAARVLRETLSRENHFYGVMATEELGLSIKPNFQSVKPADDAIAKLRERAAVKRAFALYRLADLKPEIKDLRGDALREWVVAMRNADDETLLAGAEIARQQGLPDRAINTAERTKNVHDFSQRYPLPHREPLKSNAATFGLDEAWIYGLIRQESRFMTEARSSVGAIGLMQLMPTTAKWAAKQVGVKDYSANRVSDVGINLSLGSFYLKHVLDDLGHPVLATAAYNAGPGRARRWRATVPLEGAIYAESIPFNETRDYVKKVMLNKWYYGHRIHDKSAPLSELMGTVPAKPGATTASVDRAPAGISTLPNPPNHQLAAVIR